MGGIGIILRQQVVEPVLRVAGQIGGQIKAQPAKSWRSDCYQQPRDRFTAFPQISETCFNQILTG